MCFIVESFAIVASRYEEGGVMGKKKTTSTKQERNQSLEKSLTEEEIVRIYHGYWVLMRGNIVYVYGKNRTKVLSQIRKIKGRGSIALRFFGRSSRQCAYSAKKEEG